MAVKAVNRGRTRHILCLPWVFPGSSLGCLSGGLAILTRNSVLEWTFLSGQAKLPVWIARSRRHRQNSSEKGGNMSGAPGLTRQSQSALKAKLHHSGHSQFPIYFHSETDRPRASAYSGKILRGGMSKSNVHSIVITSTVRTKEEQAEVVLFNTEHKKNIRYATAGRSVQAVAKKGIALGKTRNEIVAGMIGQIDQVGFDHVTKQAPGSGLNTIDISATYLNSSKDPESYDRFVQGLKDAVASFEVSRFGWPEGPVGAGRLFNDKGCPHGEIRQPATGNGIVNPGLGHVA